MKNKYVFRIASLFFVLTLVSATCGWIPFTAPVTIHSVPEGATVYKADGAGALGVTPYKTRVFHSEKTFEIRKEGFYDQQILVDFNAPEGVYVKLKARPVVVYTKPTADIYAKGSDTPQGNTPLEVDVYHEDRTYTLKAKDYYDKEITVGLSTKSPLVIALDRRPIITLTAIPEGTGIYENDKRIATTTLTEEILANRTFELRKEGYFKKTVELTSTSPYEITAELTPLPVITIKTTPADADIYMVGKDKPLGKGALTLTIEKATRFEVKADRYYAETFTAEPKTQTAEVKLDAMPYVTITSDPAGSEVYLAGKRLGTTPLEQLIEKPTPYEIRREGYQPQTVTLNGKDAQPAITLTAIPVVEEIVEAVEEVVEETVVEAPVIEETPVAEQEANRSLIGGIAAAVIVGLIILIAALKKKKTA